MIREYDEDEEHDNAVQAVVDDAVEAKSLLDVYCDGREAGRRKSSVEMNPHPLGSAKRDAWERGWRSTINEPLLGEAYGR